MLLFFLFTTYKVFDFFEFIKLVIHKLYKSIKTSIIHLSILTHFIDDVEES